MRPRCGQPLDTPLRVYDADHTPIRPNLGPKCCADCGPPPLVTLYSDFCTCQEPDLDQTERCRKCGTQWVREA